MKSIDIRLKPDEVVMLRGLIGKELVAIEHDEFLYTNTSSQVVKIVGADDEFFLYSFVEPLDCYGTLEDVAVWTLERVAYSPMIEEKQLMTSPIHEVIKSITLVQENQRTYDKNGEQTYSNWVTRGIIFNFSEHQLSLEKSIWFDEEIYINQGYNLIGTFTPTDEFCEDWEDGWTAECERELVELK